MQTLRELFQEYPATTRRRRRAAAQVAFRAWRVAGLLLLLATGGRQATANDAPPDEEPVLQIRIATPVVEGRSTNGLVWLNGLATSNLTVQLASSEPARLTVPAEVIIPEGSSNAVFAVSAPDDLEPELPQWITVSAQVPAGPAAEVRVELFDNDPAQLVFGPVASPQQTDQSFNLQIRAEDSAGNPLVHFEGSITLQAAGLTGTKLLQSAVAGPFGAGHWQGAVQVIQADRLVRLSADLVPGESNPFHVEASIVRSMNLPTADLAWHEPSHTLLVIVAANGGAFAHRLVAIDPVTRTVTNAYELQPHPGQLELSADRSFLYVTTSNRLALQRFELSTRQAGAAFGVGSNAFGPYSVTDFGVLAGAADGVIARLSAPAGNEGGVWRFDSGAPTQMAQFHLQLFAPYWLEAAATGLEFYGYQNNNNFPLTRTVAQSGSPVAVQDTVFSSGQWGGTMVLRDGVLYNGYGRAVSAGTFTLIGDYPNVVEASNWAGLPETDPVRNRLYYLTGRVQAGSGSYKLKAYHRGTRTPLGELALPALDGAPGRFLRWHTNQLVFNTAGRIWFVEATGMVPEVLATDLRIGQQASPLPLEAGRDFALRLTVTNAGPNIATFVTVTNPTPPGFRVTPLPPAVGTIRQTATELIWEIDRLDPGTGATLEGTARFDMGGRIKNHVTVRAYEADSLPANNTSLVWYDVQLPPQTPGTFEVVELPVEDLIYNPVTDRLWLAMSGTLVVLNPHTGIQEQNLSLGDVPTRMVPSQDQQSAYLSLKQTGMIRQLQFANLATAQSFSVGWETNDFGVFALYADDLLELPGSPGTLVVSRRRLPNPAAQDWGTGLAVHDQGVRRSEVIESGGSWRLEYDAARGELVGLNRGAFPFEDSFQLSRYVVTANGLERISQSAALHPDCGRDLTVVNDHLLTDRGRRLGSELTGVNGLFDDSATAGLVVGEPETGRAWLLAQPTPGTWQLNLHDLDRLVRLDSIAVPGVRGTPMNLIRWGTNGLAFHTTERQVFVVRTGLRQPELQAEVGLSLALPADPLAPGMDQTVRLTVTNAGPGVARDLMITQLVGAPAGLVAANCTAGECVITNATVHWQLDELPPGEERDLQFTVQPWAAGVSTLDARLSAATADAVRLNNQTVGLLRVLDPGTVSNLTSLQLPPTDFAWSPARGEILLLATNDGPWQSVLLGLDPADLTVRAHATLPGPARRLESSANEARLHLAAGSTVSTFTLPGLSFLNAFATWTNGPAATLLDFAVLPESPDSVAVAARSDHGWPRMSVFDGGAVRPVELESEAPADLEFGATDDVLHGINRYSDGTGHSQGRYALDATGITFLDHTPSYTSGAEGNTLTRVGDRLFTRAGEVIDPGSRLLLGRVPGITNASPLTYQAAAGRVFYLTRDPEGVNLRAFDSRLLVPLGSEFVGPLSAPTKLVSGGGDLLTFSTDDGQLHLWRSSLVPGGGPVDLGLQLATGTPQGEVGSSLSFQVALTNDAPVAATRVRLALQLSESVPLVVSGVMATPAEAPGTWLVDVGSIGAYESVSLTLQVVPQRPGRLILKAHVVANAPDAQPADNAAEAGVPVSLRLARGEHVKLPLVAADIAWNPVDARLLVSGAPDHIAVLNPEEALLEAMWPSPLALNRLALSDDGIYLYAGGQLDARVVRFETRNGVMDVDQFVEWATEVTDVRGLPGQSGSFVAGFASGFQNGGLQVFDGAVPRPYSVLASIGRVQLVFGDDPLTAYALTGSLGGGPRFNTVTITPEGLDLTGPWSESIQGVGEFSYAGGLIYAASGQIVRPQTGAVIDHFPGISETAAVAPEPGEGRIYFAQSSDGTLELRAHDPFTLGLISREELPGITGRPTRLLRWGTDGLAVRTSSNELILARSALVPVNPAADLAVRQAAGVSPVPQHGAATLTVEITNAGPAFASNVVLTTRAPTNVALLAWSSARGTVTAATNGLSIAWPVLAPGSSETVAVTLSPAEAGWLLHSAAVTSASTDVQLADNTSEERVPVVLNLQPNQPARFGGAFADIAYDPVHGRLYAARISDQSSAPGEILTINPLNGLILDGIPAGPDVTRVAVSDDGEKLHVINERGRSLSRIRRADKGQDFATPFASAFGPDSEAIALAPVPLQPESVVVVFKSPGLSAGTATAFRYDDALERPLFATDAREIAFFSPTGLLGYEHHRVPTQTLRLTLQPDGLVETERAGDMVAGRMSAGDGLIYTSEGQVIDPLTFTELRRLGVGGTLVAAHPAAGRVAFMAGNWSTTRLRIADTLGLHEWSTVPIADAIGEPLRLLHCGGGVLAYLSGSGQLYLLRSSVIGAGPAGDLAIGLRLPDFPLRADSSFAVELTITNLGPATAADARVTQSLPPGTRILATTASGPTILREDGTLLWDVFNLAPGVVATNRVTLSVPVAGLFPLKSVLRSSVQDPQPANDVRSALWTIHASPVPPAVQTFNFAVADLTWEPIAGRLMASVRGSTPIISNSVVVINPVAGMVEDHFPAGTRPRRLAATDDGQFLHVAVEEPAAIVRVRLADRAVVRTDPVPGAFRVRQLRAVPGRTDLVAVLMEYYSEHDDGHPAGLTMLRDGTVLDTTTAQNTGSLETIALHPSGSRLFGYDSPWYGGLHQVDFTSAEFHQTALLTGQLSGYGVRLELAGGRLVSNSGVVMDADTLNVITNLANGGPGSRVALDPAAGVASFLVPAGGYWNLRQHDWTDHSVVRELRVPGLQGEPLNLLAWGSGNLAFNTTSNQLFIVRPALAVSDVGVTIQTAPPGEVIAFQPHRIVLALTNHTTAIAPAVLVTNWLTPAGGIREILSPPALARVVNGSSPVFEVGDLPPHGTLTIELLVETYSHSSVSPVTATNSVQVASAYPDATPADNFARATFVSRADQDRDGLPDDWEQWYGLSRFNPLDAHLDLDGDGLSNLGEFLAGTLPDDPTSSLRLLAIAPGGGVPQVAFESRPGRRYALEWTSSLPTTDWLPAADIVEADGEQTVVTATGLPAGGNAFVRIRLLP